MPEGFGGTGSMLRLGPEVIVDGWGFDDHFGPQYVRSDGTGGGELCDCGLIFREVLDSDRFITVSDYDGVTLNLCRFDDYADCGSSMLAVTGRADGGSTSVSVRGTHILVSTVVADASDATVWELDANVGGERSVVLRTARTHHLPPGSTRPAAVGRSRPGTGLVRARTQVGAGALSQSVSMRARGSRSRTRAAAVAR